MSGSSEIGADYLVIGAGALGMGFVDTLIENCDADVVMIDRRHRQCQPPGPQDRDPRTR